MRRRGRRAAATSRRRRARRLTSTLSRSRPRREHRRERRLHDGRGAPRVDRSPSSSRRRACAARPSGRCVPGSAVNLERSLRVSDRLSGHFVFGHVDGIGTLDADRARGRERALPLLAARPDSARFLVEKGSIAVDGVSLTVFDCGRRSFTVSVIPHTAVGHDARSDAPGQPREPRDRHAGALRRSGRRPPSAPPLKSL